MSIELITLLMFGSMVVLLILGLPLAFTTGGIAAAFVLLLWGPPAFIMVMSRTLDIMGSFILIAVPLFVFMAAMLERSGIGEDLFKTIYHWMGSLPGGLAIATVVVCTILAAMVGIIGAGIVMMGLIALPAMLKRHYGKSIALGSIMAGGSLGILIPPSVLFIIYAMVAGVSVGKLFVGGIIPGLLLAALFIAYISIRSRLRPELAPPLPKVERLPFRQKLNLLKGLIAPVLLIILVLGSIFVGIATPSEAAGVGSLGAILCAIARRRLTWQNLKGVVFETTKVTCMIMWLIFGSSSLIGVYTLAGGARFVEEIILGLPLGPWGILIMIQIILIIMGMFIDWIGILMITGPIFVPIITALGFDPLWFGILFNLNMQISFLSPPFGPALFYLKGVAPPEITIGDLYRSIWPFVTLQLIGLILVILFPQIGLWLPALMIK